ncbi:MAG: hypothetical protein IPO07_29530 [Haliscomenobacter sp.]|nr:hypothetical protein [Haliscomenobacter sp.]MBK9492471.1 hypothetical protein [Haliscomenobacter sp.]
MKFRAAVMREVQLVGNMASWYNAVKNNPQCVASINLNDPFFQHRDINMIVDLDSEDIFSKEVNYATVNIQKKPGGQCLPCQSYLAKGRLARHHFSRAHYPAQHPV